MWFVVQTANSEQGRALWPFLHAAVMQQCLWSDTSPICEVQLNSATRYSFFCFSLKAATQPKQPRQSCQLASEVRQLQLHSER